MRTLTAICAAFVLACIAVAGCASNGGSKPQRPNHEPSATAARSASVAALNRCIAAWNAFVAHGAAAPGPIQALSILGGSCSRAVEVAKDWAVQAYSPNPSGTTSVDGFACTRIYTEPIPAVDCVAGSITVQFGINLTRPPSEEKLEKELKEGRKELCTPDDAKFGECKVGEIVPKNRQ